MTQDSLYCSSICSKAGAGSLSVFFQINMIDSSSPEAKYWPLGDHRTTLTAFWWRVRSAATSMFTEPVSVVETYQIWKDKLIIKQNMDFDIESLGVN